MRWISNGGCSKRNPQRNRTIDFAFGQTFSSEKRKHTLLWHLNDDVLRQPGRFKTFFETEEEDHGGQRRVPEIGGTKEEISIFFESDLRGTGDLAEEGAVKGKTYDSG
jgi:hypothetical protein